jgi:hypothetical protein
MEFDESATSISGGTVISTGFCMSYLNATKETTRFYDRRSDRDVCHSRIGPTQNVCEYGMEGRI